MNTASKKSKSSMAFRQISVSDGLPSPSKADLMSSAAIPPQPPSPDLEPSNPEPPSPDHSPIQEPNLAAAEEAFSGAPGDFPDAPAPAAAANILTRDEFLERFEEWHIAGEALATGAGGDVLRVSAGRAIYNRAAASTNSFFRALIVRETGPMMDWGAILLYGAVLMKGAAETMRARAAAQQSVQAPADEARPINPAAPPRM